MKFDAVIFDLGGVLINLDYQRTIHAFEALGMTNFKDVYSQLIQETLFDDFETGKISTQRFINSLLPHVHSGTSPNKVVAAWNAMILDVPTERITLLEKLNEKMPIVLLSNTNELHVEVVLREWGKVTEKPMNDFFQTVYFSHLIQLRKPHSEVFDFVCQREGFVPSKTLFIDDSIQHIDGAKSIGLQTLHLKDSSELVDFFS
jgi:HAD superfamily hydrolase (TIGR01509 family)